MDKGIYKGKQCYGRGGDNVWSKEELIKECVEHGIKVNKNKNKDEICDVLFDHLRKKHVKINETKKSSGITFKDFFNRDIPEEEYSDDESYEEEIKEIPRRKYGTRSKTTEKTKFKKMQPKEEESEEFEESE